MDEIAGSAETTCGVELGSSSSGRVVREVGPVAASFTTSFSPDGRRLAIGTFDENRVAFSPDGKRCMTGDQGITAVRVWDVGPGRGAEWANVPITAGPTGGVAFSADGRRVVAAAAGATMTVADARSGEPAFVLRAASDADDAAVIAVGRHGTLAAGAGETVRTWDLRDRRVRFHR